MGKEREKNEMEKDRGKKCTDEEGYEEELEEMYSSKMKA